MILAARRGCGSFTRPRSIYFLIFYIALCVVLTLKIQEFLSYSYSQFPERNETRPVKYKDYCIIPNVFHDSKNDQYQGITQILHVSANFLDNRLIDQVENWNAPVSLSVVLLHPQQYSCVLNRIASFRSSHPLVESLLRVHIVFPVSWSPTCDLPLVDRECIHQPASVDDIVSYPANVARNAARMFSSSKFILIADYEHLFSRGFEEEVRKVAEKTLEKDKKRLLVYRIFEIEKNATEPETKEDLKEMFSNGTAVVFHSKFYRGAHEIPKLKEWFEENSSDTGIFLENVKYNKSNWEPQFVSRSDIPMHDTSFPFLIRDNTVLRWELCREGYKLDVLSNHFMYHREIKTRKQGNLTKTVQAKNYSKFKKALVAFKKRMDEDLPDKEKKCPIFKA